MQQSNQVHQPSEEAVNALLFESAQEMNLAYSDFQKLKAEGESFGRPSLLKYSFLMLIAGIVDILDLFTFSGAGYIISLLATILGVLIILFTLWITNTKTKKAGDYAQNFEQKVKHLQARIAFATKKSLQASKVLRKFKITRPLGRAIPRGLVKIRRVLRKNPITKVLIGGAINAIPVIGVFNLYIVWIYFAYRDEKKMYQQAKELPGQVASEFEPHSVV